MNTRFTCNLRKATKTVLISFISLVLLFIASPSKADNEKIQGDSQVKSEKRVSPKQPKKSFKPETEPGNQSKSGDNLTENTVVDAKDVSTANIVSNHLQAIRQQDAHKIWEFVSEDYKKDFRSPNEALRDLRTNKKLLHDHVSFTLMERIDQNDSVIEKVELVTRNGGTALAFYRLKKNKDGIWKVDHITLLESNSKAI